MLKINFKSTADRELKTLRNFEPGSWIDIVDPNEEDIKYLRNNFDIPLDYIKNAMDEDERPGHERENGMALIIFRVPFKNVEEPISKIETIPLSIIITRGVIITISLKETEILEGFYKNKIRSFYTTKKTRFLLQILSRINYHFLKYLDMVERRVDEMELGLLKAVKNEEIIRLYGLQKTLIYFNKAVIGNGTVLDSVLKGKVVKIFKEDEDILEDIIVENKQSIEMVSVYNKILSNALETYSSIVSNNLNAVMKILTSLTIILAFPTIVASVYGMNVGLPFQNSPNAFWLTILIAVLLSFITAMIFIKKKWL